MKKILLLVSFTLFLVSSAVCDPFCLCFPDLSKKLDISGNLEYPSIVSNYSLPQTQVSGAADMTASAMFNTDLLPNLWIVPILAADFSNTAQPLTIDDERFLFTEWIDVFTVYGINYDIMKEWTLKLRGLYRTDFSKQSSDEVIGKGLYDYTDTGVYAEIFNKTTYGGTLCRLTEGFKYVDRTFRNYNTLLALSGSTLTPNAYTREKDTLIYSLYATGETIFDKSGWSAVLDVDYDYIPYFEQKIIADNTGALEDKNRIDKNFSLSLTLPYKGQDDTGVSLNYTLNRRISNQNLYDNMGTSDPSDDVLIPDYYSDWESTGTFAIKFLMPFRLTAMPVETNISFTADFVNYDSRLAKESTGVYTGSRETDNNYTATLGFKEGITANWNVFLNGSYSRYSSNMKYEALGLFNYTYLTISLGTGLSF